MTHSPLQSLAENIATRLAEAGIIQTKRKKDMITKLANGKLSDTDWRGEVERQLASETSSEKIHEA